ncbi:MAG: NAD(P)H-dependent oxidoreductase [Sphingomonadales bacterium]
MPKRILIIQGHPDTDNQHFCHALADAYGEGAQAGGHACRQAQVAALGLPTLRNQEEFNAPPPAAVSQCQDDIAWAEHLLIVYPLWLGTMPAVLKGYFEQVFRPGFAFGGQDAKGLMAKRLTGKSARVVITMGMPAFLYRWYFGAHSLKSLERNILHFVGIKPVRESLIGLVESSAAKRANWLRRMHKLGRQGR